MLLILVVGLLYALVVWACGLAGIPVPTRALQILCAIVIVIGLIALLNGGALVRAPSLRW